MNCKVFFCRKNLRNNFRHSFFVRSQKAKVVTRYICLHFIRNETGSKWLQIQVYCIQKSYTFIYFHKKLQKNNFLTFIQISLRRTFEKTVASKINFLRFPSCFERNVFFILSPLKKRNREQKEIISSQHCANKNSRKKCFRMLFA